MGKAFAKDWGEERIVKGTGDNCNIERYDDPMEQIYFQN